MKELPKTYKDLLFWKKSFEASILVIRIAKKLPRDLEIRIILGQLLRSVMSIGANIAEGYGRFGPKEFTRYLQVSLGSANETEYWLLLLKECSPKFSQEIDEILNKNREVVKMLAKSIQTLKSKVN